MTTQMLTTQSALTAKAASAPMRRLIAVVFGSIASLASAADAGISMTYPYTVFPPYITTDASNQLTGWHGNLAKALFNKAGIKTEYAASPYARTLSIFKDGDIPVMQYADMGTGLKPEQFYFPVPNVTLEVVVFSKQEMTAESASLAKIGEGKFAIVRSWPLGKYTSLVDSPKAQPVNSVEQVVQMILNDRVDAAIMLRSPYDAMRAKGQISESDAKKIKMYTVDKVIANSFAVPKNAKNAEKFNAALASAYKELVKEGKVNEACVCLKTDN